jgi:hypothetical protein
MPLEPSSHPKILLARPPYPGAATLLDVVSALEHLSNGDDRAAAGVLLHDLAWQAWTDDEVINLDEIATIGVPETVE